MILGREPGGVSCRASQKGIGGVGGGQERTWASRRVGRLKRGAPESAGAWEKGSQQGRVQGAGAGRLGGLGWSGSPATFLFFPRYFAVFRHLVLLMVVPVTTCFWIFGLTVQRVGS